jgi:MFS family permease
MLEVLKNREYRLLWIGQGVSHLGDQFHLIALPWLVLAITNDPLQLGLVMALAGIPRALVMLFGGAIADRISPRLLMLGSDLVRLVITAGLVTVLATGAVRLWMIYALAISFGLISGIFLPAAEATLPRVVQERQLAGGNSLMMIADQVAQFVGPALAGSVIALLAHGVATSPAGMTGIAIAFAVDAVSFAVGAFTLFLMRPVAGFGSERHPLRDIADGVRFVWNDVTIRTLVLVIALANLMLTGPLLVGLPVLAQQRLPEGAAAYGVVLSGYALGNLIGMALAGIWRPNARQLGWIGFAIFPFLGAIYSVIGLIDSTVLAAALMVVGGVGNGYLAIIVITQLQQMTPKPFLGRVMSVVMLSMYGLGPISQIVAGWALQFSVGGLFLGASAGLIIPAVIALRHRSMWDFTPADPESRVAEPLASA